MISLSEKKGVFITLWQHRLLHVVEAFLEVHMKLLISLLAFLWLRDKRLGTCIVHFSNLRKWNLKLTWLFQLRLLKRFTENLYFNYKETLTQFLHLLIVLGKCIHMQLCTNEVHLTIHVSNHVSLNKVLSWRKVCTDLWRIMTGLPPHMMSSRKFLLTLDSFWDLEKFLQFD